MDYIIEYINDNFNLTKTGLKSFTVFDKHSNCEVSLHTLNREIEKMFNLSDDDLFKIIEIWIDDAILTISN